MEKGNWVKPGTGRERAQEFTLQNLWIVLLAESFEVLLVIVVFLHPGIC